MCICPYVDKIFMYLVGAVVLDCVPLAHDYIITNILIICISIQDSFMLLDIMLFKGN